MMTYIVALLCVLGLTAGQILFKVCATALAAHGSLFSAKAAGALFAAVCLYGVTSIAWVWVLQKIELGHVYPLMALAFVLVPLGSYFAFGERFTSQYFVGVTMIMAGIIVAIRG